MVVVNCELVQTNHGDYKCKNCCQHADKYIKKDCLIKQPKMVKLKLFGLPHSCTTLAEYEIKSNFEDIHIDVKTKHAPLSYNDFNENFDGTIVCTKDIYSQLASLWERMNKPFDNLENNGYSVYLGNTTWRNDWGGHIFSSFYEFLQYSDSLVSWHNFPNRQVKIPKNQIEYINTIWKIWFVESIFHFKYIDYLINPDELLDNLQNKFNLPLSHNKPYIHVDGYCYYSRPNEKKFDGKDYYINKNYMKYYDQKTLNFVNNHIDKELYKKIGYEICDTV